MKLKVVKELLSHISPQNADKLNRCRNEHEIRLVIGCFPSSKASGEQKLYLSVTGSDVIGVIKTLRTYSNMGLREAKDLHDVARDRGEALIPFPVIEVARFIDSLAAVGGKVRIG